MKRRLRYSVFACGGVLLFLATTYTAVHAQSAVVLWKADMESTGNPGPDLSQWSSPITCPNTTGGGDVESSGIASAGPSFNYNHTPNGLFSAMLTIQTPDTAQVPESGVRLFRWQEPQTYPDLYYSTWFYFPQLYTPNDPVNPWWDVMTWKSKHCPGGVCSSDPFFDLAVGETTYNGQQVMYFYLFNSHSQTSYAQSPPYTFIPAGQWFQVEIHYVCAGDTTGRITVWQNGSSTPLFDVPNVQTRYADGDCQWSVNNYSNSLSPTPATIYADDAAICQGGRCPWPLP